MELSKTQTFAHELIAFPSVTPNDCGIQKIIAKRLSQLGFECETIMSGPDNFHVTNLWAIKRSLNVDSKVIVFAGHTDVVPTGPLNLWDSDPFLPSIREGKLFGRGAADMKTSLAAFIIATEEYINDCPKHNLSIGFLLTSDEEGPLNTDGTVVVCNLLKQREENIDFCIIGEPTSSEKFGDTIKNGRRGSLSAKLKVKGVQGHIAYPHLAVNPIHLVSPALAELSNTTWDHGNEYFPPTSWQTSNFHSGTGATNVIPGEAIIDFNFRFATASTASDLKHKVELILNKHGLVYEIEWNQGGEPFLTPQGDLCNVLRDSITRETGIIPSLSTTGGTSDGRFISKICPQVVEFGPINKTIHQVNEYVDIDTIDPLKNIYRHVLDQLSS
ncbi:MAG: succinyl-diaminopimelate desuccinylase [Betaproteobacteria bacterium]